MPQSLNQRDERGPGVQAARDLVVNDDHVRRAMTLARGGDPKRLSKRVSSHELIVSREVTSRKTTPGPR